MCSYLVSSVMNKYTIVGNNIDKVVLDIRENWDGKSEKSAQPL